MKSIIFYTTVILTAMGFAVGQAFATVAIFEFFLGAVQLFHAAILTINWKHLSPKVQRLMKIYWMVVGIYFTVFALFSQSIFKTEFGWLLLFSLPWGIAIYFSIINLVKDLEKTQKRSRFLPNLS